MYSKQFYNKIILKMIYHRISLQSIDSLNTLKKIGNRNAFLNNSL